MRTHPGKAGTFELATHDRFDEKRLSDWLERHVAGFRGPLRITKFKGGQSNPTYKLDTPSRAYVLRRKPSGQLLKGAHAIEREARVVSALEAQGFPVPRVHGLCTDDEVIGSWFYVMDLVEGRIFWDATFLGVPPDERAAYFEAMNATLAALHGIDPVAAGLGDFGRAENYVSRQIARWSKQYLDDTLAGRDAAMDKLVRWLPAHVPSDVASSVVHGDFRVDNMIFHPSEPRVIAVLDWELSTLGHPVSDFAYHAMMFRMPTDILGGLAGIDLQALGLPTEAQYVANYCKRTKRVGIPDLDFYIAFNMFRFASILHGIRGRVMRGNAASQDAGAMAANFERVAALAWAQAAKSGG